MTIAGQQHHQPYYILHCCSGQVRQDCVSHQRAHAPPRAICCSGLTDQYELDHRLGHCCSGPTQLQPRNHEGQHQRGGLEEVGGHQVIHHHQVGEHQSLPLYGGPCEHSEIQSENNSDEMVLETSHLWNGVSGVPGLGVSIPRPQSSAPGSSLEEWDRHEYGCKRKPEDVERKSSVPTSTTKKDSQVGSRNSGPLSLGGVKVELPRVISPRSSSCRSSGRSTGSRGSSALSQGLSNGSSASSAKYSNRSDSVFSVHAPLPRIQSPLRGSQERGAQRTIIPHSQYDHHHHHHNHPQYGHHAQPASHHQPKSIQNPVKSFHRSSHDRPNAKRKGPSNSSSDSGPTSLPVTCECVCTCGDPVPPKPVRRVMFSDDTCCCEEDKLKSLPVFTESHSSHDCCCSSPRFAPDHEEGHTHGPDFCSASVPNNHYKSPRDVDGEYSYAYSDSVSPAFLIRVGAAMEYSGSQDGSADSRDENIYEEIREKSEEVAEEKSPPKDSRKSSTTSQEISSTSTEAPKSKFQKALDAVTRRSSRSLDAGSEKAFHLSISKGRKKSLIDKAKVDWDCEGTPGMISKFNKSSSDMFGEVNACHNRVMSQLKLDVEDMLMPPPSPPGDETQDDSGFHSGGMSSNNSYSPKSKRKSIIKPPKTAKRSESQPGRMNRCESIDFKEAFNDGRKTSEVFRTRSKIISDHNGTYGNAVYGPPTVYSAPPPPPILVQNGNKKGTVNRSYLSKLVNFPFMGSNKNHPPIYGKNNNLPPNYEDESGRTFYL